MDLHYSQTKATIVLRAESFTTLWIYTILKPVGVPFPLPVSFTTLWIYTILKLGSVYIVNLEVSLPYGFTLFSNLINAVVTLFPFHYLMDLHYSQTVAAFDGLAKSFTTLWIYTILKQKEPVDSLLPVSLPYGFTLFSNKVGLFWIFSKFHYLMDLHYSQT